MPLIHWANRAPVPSVSYPAHAAIFPRGRGFPQVFWKLFGYTASCHNGEV